MMTDVLISAGHYPGKPGAVFGDLVEHTEAMLWRDGIIRALVGHVSVAPVPVGVLREKVAFINLVAPKLAVEIHFNDAWVDRNADGEIQDDEHVGRGSESLYMPGSADGKLAATILQDRLSVIFPPNRGAKEGWYRMDPKYGPDFFLARTICPAVIIEPEFVGNAEAIRNNRSAGCSAIASGIIDTIRAFASY